MRNYLGKYGVYVAAGFVVVFLATLGFIAIMRLKASDTANIANIQPTPTPLTREKPIPTVPESDAYARLSFSLQISPTIAPTSVAMVTGGPVAIAGTWECTQLTASPVEGTAPLSVRFTATAKKPNASTSVSFDFVFGDDTEQTIEKVSSSGKTTETQNINHTYTKSGKFTASVLIPDDTGKTTDPEQLCQVDVAVGGLLARGPTTAPTIPPQPTIKATPTLQASAPTDSPTRIPTTAPVATDTPIPVPKLPESGAFIPTALAVVGGAAIILLGILL